MENIDYFDISDQKARDILENTGVSDFLKKGQSEEISPKWDDLLRLYLLIRERKPYQVLEFGSGFSTLVIGFALRKNWEEYLKIANGFSEEEKIRMPSVISLESINKWKENTEKKINKVGLEDICRVMFSEISIAEYQGQVCHFYDELPDIVPDFVYLDGPDPATVKGSINGLSFQQPKRTVMSGDILKYESTLLPGFFMIVDGRSNNARFLQRMLNRSYKSIYHEKADVTTFELDERRLGRKNIYGKEGYTRTPVTFAGIKIQ